MCETHGHGDDHFGRLIVMDKNKYIANKGDRDELYNLREDPYELINLIEKPDAAGILLEMKERLSVWQRRTGDNKTIFKANLDYHYRK